MLPYIKLLQLKWIICLSFKKLLEMYEKILKIDIFGVMKDLLIITRLNIKY